MTVQEENWELMSWLNMSWFDCEKLNEDDKKFLLVKAAEISDQSKAYYEAQVQQMMENQSQGGTGEQPPPPTTAAGQSVRPW